jgi:hypothetical protein
LAHSHIGFPSCKQTIGADRGDGLKVAFHCNGTDAGWLAPLPATYVSDPGLAVSASPFITGLE